MSKPSEVTKKQMLKELTFLISTQDPYYRTDKKVISAIRHLIEKVFEWQEKAEELWEASPTLERFQDNVPLKKFIKEIRDFGKEEK